MAQLEDAQRSLLARAVLSEQRADEIERALERATAEAQREKRSWLWWRNQ
jgi:hypothetical protein